MFCSTTTTHTSNQHRSSLISALDGFVAFATLESYGVIDGRDAPARDLALERRLRARRRDRARVLCAANGSAATRRHGGRAAPLTGQL